jgi:hypothetical protein
MKTLIALTIALAGFGSTLAWGAEPATASPPTSATAAAKAPRASAAKNVRTTRTPVTPAFDERLLQGPATLCACGRNRTQA